MLLLCGGECSGGVDVFDIMVVLVLELNEEEDARRMHSQVRKLFLKGLVWEEKVKWGRYLPCLSLLPTSLSPWWKTLSFGKEFVLITVTGFDYHTFYVLLDCFDITYEEITIFGKYEYSLRKARNKRGRKTGMSAEDCL
eukprot:9731962-Ditylum_brightwellii.AAC.1